MDKIVVEREGDIRFCVSCGFSDERPSPSATRELPTRATRGAARRLDTPVQVVKLVDAAGDDDEPR